MEREAALTYIEVVHERTVAFDEAPAADEIVAAGNDGKVTPLTRIERRDRQPGPVCRRARDLSWDVAHSSRR